MRTVYAVVLLALLSAPVHADEWMTGITYNISFPGSEIKDFTNESPSWRGLGFEVKKFVTPAFSVGGSVDWTVFKEETVEQITVRREELNGDITGKQFRYFNSVPVMGTFHFHLGDEDSARAFVGAGVGVFWIEQRVEVGSIAFTQSNWHFGFVPEGGAIIPMGDAVNFLAKAKYYYAAKAGSSLQGDGLSYSYFGLNVGISWAF